MNIKNFRAGALWGILTMLAPLLVGATPAFAMQTQPPTTTSYYVAVGSTETNTSIDSWAYNAGYALGQRDLGLTGTQNSSVILDFGSPYYNGTSYGTTGRGRFMSVNDVRLAVVAFAHGYYVGTGTDTSSQLTIITGVNNSGSTYIDYNDGRAWSFLIQNIASDFVTNGYSSQVSSRGGIDAEPDYSTATASSNWMSGYTSAYTSPYYVYDYGAASGCPQSGSTATAGSCNNSWTQYNVWYMSWGASPALPLPEIYATSGANAKQWQQLSLYSYLAYGAKMGISSPLSEYQACQQKGGCAVLGIDNTASAAWSQLWTYLNADTRTAQNLVWSDDISWR